MQFMWAPQNGPPKQPHAPCRYLLTVVAPRSHGPQGQGGAFLALPVPRALAELPVNDGQGTGQHRVCVITKLGSMVKHRELTRE